MSEFNIHIVYIMILRHFKYEKVNGVRVYATIKKLYEISLILE